MNNRKLFFKEVKEDGSNLLEILPLLDVKNYYYPTLVHDATMLEEFPKVYNELLKKRNELKCWIIRILIKNNLPRDLGPTIMAFSVTGFNLKWNFMR